MSTFKLDSFGKPMPNEFPPGRPIQVIGRRGGQKNQGVTMKNVLFVSIIATLSMLSACKTERHGSFDPTAEQDSFTCDKTTCTRAEERHTCFDEKEQLTRVCNDCRMVSAVTYGIQPPNPDCPVMDAATVSEPSPSYTSTIGVPGTSLYLPCDRKHQGQKQHVPEIKSTLVCWECHWVDERAEGAFINLNCR
jgi:hypothetical protein